MTTVHPSNAETARAWDNRERSYWVERETSFDRAMAVPHQRLLDAAAIRAADRILDIGCGNGQTTRDAARRASAGSALGIDVSALMLDRARLRTAEAGITNATFVHGDATIQPFEPASFDLTVSRMGVMFFGEPELAFANIARALRPGGRLVVAVWQDLAHNEWLREITNAVAAGRPMPTPPPDAPGPMALGDPERVRQILGAAGFQDVGFEDVQAPSCYGSDAEDAFGFISGLVETALREADEPTRARAVAGLRETIATHDTGRGIYFQSAAWIVTART